MLDYLGYIASGIILLSMLMKDMKKFRIVNTVACLLFVVYATIREDYPVVFLNATVVLINILFLIRSDKKIK
tara:strand:+ start:1762 stop:1977 length:216 start_codon:yes stop_codon:yes gene_type:complete